MFLKFISFLVISSFCYASENNKNNEEYTYLESEYEHNIENSNEYITASAMYNTKNYQKSYELFYALFLKDNKNVNINYFLALSAIKIGLFDEASASLERVLIEKPDFNQARLIYAKLLYDLNLRDESKKEFEILKNAKTNDESKKIINEYLKKLNIKIKDHLLQGSILVGVGRNSNANGGYDNPFYSGFEFGESPVYDNMHHEMIALNSIKSFEKVPNTFFINKFMVYNKNYFNQKDENLQIYSYKPSINYRNKNNLYALSLGINRIKKRDNDSFNMLEISPSFDNGQIYSALSFQKILYLSHEDKENNFNKYDYLLKYNLLNNLALYSKLSKSIRTNETKEDLDKNSILAGLEYLYLINNQNLLQFNSEYSIIRYKYNYLYSFFDNKREDDNFYNSLSYIYKYDKNNQIILSSSFMKNNSSYDMNDYKEFDGKINFVRLFNY